MEGRERKNGSGIREVDETKGRKGVTRGCKGEGR